MIPRLPKETTLGKSRHIWKNSTKSSGLRCYLYEYLHVKTQGYPCIPSRNNNDSRIQQSDLMRVSERIFPDMGFAQENCEVFHFRIFQQKSNDKNLRKLEKTPFWVHFGSYLHILGQVKIFLENL